MAERKVRLIWIVGQSMVIWSARKGTCVACMLGLFRSNDAACDMI